jgi:predicted DsbA family dithiol-disulfide isomerase
VICPWCFVGKHRLDRGYAISGAQEPEMFLPMFDIAASIVDPIMAEA